MEFRIERMNRPELVFEGEVLARVNAPKHDAFDETRGYELALYTNAAGGYVASVEYLTTCVNEQSVVCCEQVDEPKDVENFFLVFEPCEYLDQQLLRSLTDDQKLQLRKALCRLYDSHVDAILKSLHEHHPKADAIAPSDASTETEHSRQKNGLLGFFGMN